MKLSPTFARRSVPAQPSANGVLRVSHLADAATTSRCAPKALRHSPSTISSTIAPSPPPREFRVTQQLLYRKYGTQPEFLRASAANITRAYDPSA